MQRLFVFFITVLTATIILISVPFFNANENTFDYDIQYDYKELFSDNFDGKNSAQIKENWAGVYKDLRPNPVDSDGWLYANWNTALGLGYYFKTSHINVKYEFDFKYNLRNIEDVNKPLFSDINRTSLVVLRSKENAGGMYGQIDLENANGVGLVLNYGKKPGKVLILIADVKNQKAPMHGITYEASLPASVSFVADEDDPTKCGHITILDLDDTIVYYFDGIPFASIVFSNPVLNYYTTGKIFDGDGNLVKKFGNTNIPRTSNFAIANRVSDVLIDNFSISEPLGDSSIYNAFTKGLVDYKFDDFDNKTDIEVKEDWIDFLWNQRTDLVSDGWLKAVWDIGKGIGLYYKESLQNVVYDFDVKYSNLGYSALIALRSPSNGGSLFGDYSSEEEKGRGIGFYYASTLAPGMALIGVADESSQYLRYTDFFQIPYPKGVDFLTGVHMTIYDNDDTILYFANNKPIGAIKLFDLSGSSYTRGIVYNYNGYAIGSFNKKVPRTSNFAITDRLTEVYLDNFRIRKINDSFSYEGSQIRTVLVPYRDSSGVLHDDDQRQGLRFCFDMPENDSTITVNGNSYSVVKTGALVGLEEAISQMGEIRVENLSGKVVNLETLIPYTENDNTYLSAYIYNIPESAKDLVISAVPYIKYTDGTNEFYLYGGIKRQSVSSVYKEIALHDDTDLLDEDVIEWWDAANFIGPSTRLPLPQYDVESVSISNRGPNGTDDHTPVLMKSDDHPEGTQSLGLRFKAEAAFDYIEITCPSYSDSIGNLTFSIYNWDTDYATSISKAPLRSKEFVDFTDNAKLRLFVGVLPEGEYLFVISNAVQKVGVWTFNNTLNNSTFYRSGVASTGSLEGTINFLNKRTVYFG